MSHPLAAFGLLPTANSHVLSWVKDTAELTRPDRVFWCDGSEAEREALYAAAVDDGVLIRLNQEKLPGCYYHRSNPNDVARVEQCTYICTDAEVDAGPTNNWAEPKAMRQKLTGLARDGMKGRMMTRPLSG